MKFIKLVFLLSLISTAASATEMWILKQKVQGTDRLDCPATISISKDEHGGVYFYGEGHSNYFPRVNQGVTCGRNTGEIIPRQYCRETIQTEDRKKIEWIQKSCTGGFFGSACDPKYSEVSSSVTIDKVSGTLTTYSVINWDVREMICLYKKQ